MHPLMRKNYGQWKWHERPRPGVLHHVSAGGDEIWTVRAGTQRQMDTGTIRELCRIADTFAEGHVRFTVRSNIEFMVSEEAKVGPLIEALSTGGFPIGGTGNSVSMIAHTQGFLHCDIPGTDASGVAKSLMDEFYEEFVNRTDAEPRAPFHLLLSDQLRWPGRYLDQHPTYQAAQDQS